MTQIILWLLADPSGPRPITRFLIRDRDGVHGCALREQVKAMEIEEVTSLPGVLGINRDHGRVMEIPEVGGSHHRYERRAA